MTRTIRGDNTRVSFRWAWAVGAAVVATLGCGGNDKKASEPCPAGDETCHCYGNHTCNGSLTCASDICVNLSAGGSSSVGGGAATTGTSTTSNTTTSPQGGSTALTSSLAGGSDSIGGGVGGAPNTGGALPSFGGNSNTVAQGGVAASGGNGSVGGNTTGIGTLGIGGISPAGGQPTVGGNLATGGDTGVVVTTPVGGQNPGGGASNVADTSASVGGSTGGATAATGGAPPNTCGNGTVEGTEGCDPSAHDNNLGDGCTPLCKVEPSCPASGGACTTRCGDGFVLDGEACDDGNTVSADGCSSSCQVEPDFDCVQSGPGNAIVLPLVVRDFNAGYDFELAFTDMRYATQGLLKPTLDAQGLKPELLSNEGTYYGLAGTDSGIHSADSFAQWYNDAAPNAGNEHNGTLATALTLYFSQDAFSGQGAHVNRWGPNGENWILESDPLDNWCGNVGLELKDAEGKPIPCTYCPADDPDTPECDYPQTIPCDDKTNFLRCEQSGNSYFGVYAEDTLYGTPLFFPADSIAPASPSMVASIPDDYYGGRWAKESSGKLHNFSFTTETRFWFKYDATKILRLSFVGDDDAWVFVNKKLAIDVGGIHTPVVGTLTVNTDGTSKAVVSSPSDTNGEGTARTPVELGLEDGKIYEVAVFQAERQTSSSTYLLSFTGFNTGPSVCTHK